MWNVEGPSGKRLGQAAKFEVWDLVEEGGREVTPADRTAAARAAVEEQGEVVRGLKEGQGLTNQDERVVAGVAELMRRKARVAELEESDNWTRAASGSSRASHT